jgi:hypothetical protein
LLLRYTSCHLVKIFIEGIRLLNSHCGRRTQIMINKDIAKVAVCLSIDIVEDQAHFISRIANNLFLQEIRICIKYDFKLGLCLTLKRLMNILAIHYKDR